MVPVSQAPVVSEASATVAPPAAGGTVTALPSAVQDLARFFLSLAGSSTQGAVGSVAGVSVPASGAGVQLCPSAPGGGAGTFGAAMTTPSLAARFSSGSVAVPGSSSLQQREEETSRPSRRRRRSSSGGAGQVIKRQTRDHSSSRVRSSHRREASHRSSPSSSGEDRAVSPHPTSRHAPGCTPYDSGPAPAGDYLPCPGPSGWWPRSSAAAERHCLGFGGHLSPSPLGEADDDSSVALYSLDIDQDDSFRSVLALIQNFHGLKEPAGVPSARCKTSLASIYGLMLETSPAFHLPFFL